MSLKPIITGVAAATLVGAAAGVISIASAPSSAVPAVAPVVFSTPLPQDVDPSLTSEFTGILDQLANSGKISDKGYLIEGGLGFIEGKTADRLLKNAAQKGELPLSFSLTPPDVNGDTATTTVTATSPSGTPVTQPMTFVNNNGWKVSKASAEAIMQAAMAAS